MIEQLIQKISQQLDRDNIPYMIIGGQAVLIYGRPRLTRDIDITLGLHTDQFSKIASLCQKLKLVSLTENPEDFARQTMVFPIEDPVSKIRIDFIFSFSEYEAQAIRNTRSVLIENYPVKFASCEDVIIHKMIAGRAIDDEDVKSILAKNKTTLDMKYIEKWLKEFSQIPEYETILSKWKLLIK